MNKVNMVAPPNPAGLTEYEKDALSRLYDVWSRKLTRNQLKKKYYRAKNSLKDLGIALPPKMKNLETALGWPAKAVDMLAARSRFDGFVYDGEVEGIDDILRDNNFNLLYNQAVNSELIHSCSFITVSKGGVGEPKVIVSAYSAETAAGIWDSRKKCLECGMTVVEVDEDTKMPVWINLYTSDAIVEMRKKGSVWVAIRHRHGQGRPLMEALVHKPELDRPMGKSRITRTVMALTDSAIRTSLRSELSAEFYTSPQRYFLGVDESLFQDQSKWEAYIGNIMAITRDENGDIPHVGQFPQMTMQPHTDYMRSLAALFSGETNIPVNALGIIHDNPSSAEAIRAAENYLIIDAQDLNDTNGQALRNIGLLIHAIRNNTTIDRLSPEEASIHVKWRNPSLPSVVSQADAILKHVQAIPWIAETEVALEELGYDEEQRMRLLGEKRRLMAQQALEQARQEAMAQEQQEGGKVPNATMYMMKSIIESYKRGAITRATARTLFKSVGIEDEQAEVMLNEAEEEAVTDDGNVAQRA